MPVFLMVSLYTEEHDVKIKCNILSGTMGLLLYVLQGFLQCFIRHIGGAHYQLIHVPTARILNIHRPQSPADMAIRQQRFQAFRSPVHVGALLAIGTHGDEHRGLLVVFTHFLSLMIP